MPKVAFVAHWDWVLWNYRMPLATALRDRGWEVVMVAPPGRYAPRFKDVGLGWVEWPVQRRSLNPVSELAAVGRLMRIYRRERPDLVHHFTIKPNLYGSLAIRLGGLVSRSGDGPAVINTFTGLGFLFGPATSARVLRTLTLPLLGWALRVPGGWTVTQTETDRRRLLQQGLIDGERSSVIPGTGVDVDVLRPTDLSNDDRPPVVLLAARLLWDKGIREFVEAAAGLHEAGVEAEFWLAGAPDEGNPSSIPESVARQWHDSGTIRWLGHRDDMRDLLTKVDLAVLPSYSEGVPLFLLEAAACGLPIVATDIEGCRSVVVQGVNGLLVSPRDVDGLAEAMGRLIRDGETRSRMGVASRRIAEDRFASREIIAKFISLYEALIGRGPATAPNSP